MRAQHAQLQEAYYHSPAAIAGSGRGAAVTSAVLVPGHASSAGAGTGPGWSLFCPAPTTAFVVPICPLVMFNVIQVWPRLTRSPTHPLTHFVHACMCMYMYVYVRANVVSALLALAVNWLKVTIWGGPPLDLATRAGANVGPATNASRPGGIEKDEPANMV